MKKFFKRIKSQKGMSGVLVALLLVIVGVGLVAGLNTYMGSAKNAMLDQADTDIGTAIGDNTFAGTRQ